ncbi:Transposase and inactivated derivatives [Avibacterium volantium]|uniref:Transposase and inactivated derivatives n=1 Tax=Avibacterium volantium TaxID=762 RepID=A0A447SSF2_AVIVO|nr:Transposase and inactivated derivatives [Avibacterium volantium]
MLKRDEKVYTVVVENTKTDTLLPVIEAKLCLIVLFTPIIITVTIVLDVSEFKYFRINHSTHFAKAKNHINEIESFWNQAKRELREYSGIDKKSSPVFLKECESRFNAGTVKESLKMLQFWCRI